MESDPVILVWEKLIPELEVPKGHKKRVIAEAKSRKCLLAWMMIGYVVIGSAITIIVKIQDEVVSTVEVNSQVIRVKWQHPFV